MLLRSSPLFHSHFDQTTIVTGVECSSEIWRVSPTLDTAGQLLLSDVCDTPFYLVISARLTDAIASHHSSLTTIDGGLL